MTMAMKRFWKAAMTLFGGIVGVGIFAVPYTLSRAGVWAGIVFFVILGAVQMLSHLFLAEAAMASPEKERLRGLAYRFLGKKAGDFAGIVTVLGLWASLLAYIIVGGAFLHVLFSPLIGGSVFMYQIGWAVVGGVVLLLDLSFLTKIDVAATAALLIAVVAILVWGSTRIYLANYAAPHLPDYLIPYGIVLFSLGGLPAIPELEDILAGRHKWYRMAIIVGTVGAVVVTAAFGYVVLGVTGAATTADAVTGLKNVFSPAIGYFVAIFGFFAVATSFFPNGLNLRSTLRYDYGLSPRRSWLATVLVPTALFLFGAKNFIGIIGFAGTVFGSAMGVIAAFMYIAITKKGMMSRNALGVPVQVAYLTTGVLLVGALLVVGASVRSIFSS